MTSKDLSFRRTRAIARATVLAATSALLLSACAKELDGGTRHSMFVRQALAPPLARTTGACIYSDGADAATLFSGTVDLGVRDDFQLMMLVQGLDNPTGTSITRAHVAVRVGEELLREFEVTTTGYIKSAGFGVVSVTGIDAPTAQILLERLPNRAVAVTTTVEVQVFGGDPAGGGEASTPVFRFPVKACNGCLVDFSTGNEETAAVQPNCLKPLFGTQPLPCYAGQDEPVPCQLCVGARAACNPTTP
jgi:hypothetical protein